MQSIRTVFMLFLLGCVTACGSSNGPASSGGSDDPLVKRGKALYKLSCETCHGAEGHGDGPSASQFKPPINDFAKLPWKTGTDDATIRKVIREGIPGTAMPSSASLSEKDLDALVAFVKTMIPKSEK